jgi:hypothetical protein
MKDASLVIPRKQQQEVFKFSGIYLLAFVYSFSIYPQENKREYNRSLIYISIIK